MAKNTTVNDQAVRRVVDEMLDRDGGHETFKVLRNTAAQIQRGEFGWWADFVGHEFFGTDIYDAYAFLLLQQALHAREILIAEIEIRAVPGANKDLKGNQQLLDARLPKEFKAKINNSPRDDDGYLKWTERIAVATIKCDDCERQGGGQERREVFLRPSQASLEIGSTSAAKTYVQLALDGALVRWPYRRESLYLAVRVVPWETKSPGEETEPIVHDAFHAIE